jgi:uncharacterized RDD family membrane protein YckC
MEKKKARRKTTAQYISSIIFDYAICTVPCFVFFSSMEAMEFGGYPIGIIILAISVTTYLFFGDKIFRNKSLGKLILGIRIVRNDRLGFPTWGNVLVRRILEWLWPIHAMFGFLKDLDLDEATETHIEESRPKK